MKEIEIEEVIKNYKVNGQINNIKKLYYKTDNIFKILHQETYENKHSIFLSWLFNPDANNGLGTTFAQMFFDKVFGENIIDLKKSKIHNVIIEKRTNGQKQKETKKDKKRIDILIEGSDFTCTIENKYGSNTHDNQCANYKEYINGKYPDKENKFVFLDINMPKDFKENHETVYANYDFIEYRAIKGILEDLLKTIKNSSNQYLFIHQYKEILDELYGDNNDKYELEIKKICDDLDPKDALLLCTITDDQYENLGFDEKIFVDTVKKYCEIKKNDNDKLIEKCLEDICDGKYFFKNDYGQKKEMYANTLAVSYEFVDTDKINYLFKVKKINEVERDRYKYLFSKKVKDLSREEKEEKKTFNVLFDSIKANKGFHGVDNIPFQTVDFVAPNTKCAKISIDIYAGLIPRYSKYICDYFTQKENNKKTEDLFELKTKKKWNISIKFYVRNGSGVKYVKLSKTEIAEKELYINNSEELLEVLTIGKKFYKGGTKKTVDEIKNLMNDLKVLNRFIDKKETIESFMERCFNTKSTKFLLGYSIVLKYEIADKYCNEKDLKSIFYDKTLQGTSIFNYNEWFKNKVFK